MATESLSLGRAITITQNTVYALPGALVMVHSDTAIEVSNSTSTGFVALTGANTVGAPTSAQFVRCTTANAIVSVKAY